MTVVNLYLSLGLLAGMLVVSWISRWPAAARLLWIVGCATGLVGARLAGGGTDPFGHSFQGLSSLGLGAGFMAGVWICGRLLHSPDRLGELLDDLTPGLAAALALGRTGCWVAGCHGGSVTTVPWAVTYGSSSSVYAHQLWTGQIDWLRAESLPVHPLALYEVGFTLLGLLVLLLRWRWMRRRLPTGLLLPLAVTGYAGLRVALELGFGAASGHPPLAWMAVALASSVWIILEGRASASTRSLGPAANVTSPSHF